jgi:hypothetical protein
VAYTLPALGVPGTLAGPVGWGGTAVTGATPDYYDFRSLAYDRGTTTFPGCIAYWLFDGSTLYTLGGSILDEVFEGQPWQGTNAAAFAQAADDVRRMIEFTHLLVTGVQYVDVVYDASMCP